MRSVFAALLYLFALPAQAQTAWEPLFIGYKGDKAFFLEINRDMTKRTPEGWFSTRVRQTESYDINNAESDKSGIMYDLDIDCAAKRSRTTATYVFALGVTQKSDTQASNAWMRYDPNSFSGTVASHLCK